MIPSWIVNTLVIILGCIFAIYFGSSLPGFDQLGAYLVGFLIVCTICLVTNNFPALLALAVWYPFPPPVPFFRAFPLVALVLAWFALVLFFKLCMDKSLVYIRSFNWWLVLCFAWVPLRFMLNPIHKLGSGVGGGQGISGANTYFLYALAGITLISVGFILSSRKQIINYMKWSFWLVLINGMIFLSCAFIPSTGPFLASMGMFQAGNLTDGIQRIVVLPGYGLFLVQAALCPGLFSMSKFWSIVIFPLGLVMIAVGGNRSAVAAAIIAAPIIFILRRQFGTLLLNGVFFILIMIALNGWINTLNSNDVPGLVRGLGVFNSKIEDATGGVASANWRYAVWQSGLGKIAEAPLIGKGFGNLDKHIDPNDMNKAKGDTDFEVVLASGEAHNGFISAAYGFGVPFMIVLALGLFWRMFSNMKSAWQMNPNDSELRDFYAFIGSTLATYSILVYSAFDMCTTYFWVYIGLGFMMDRLSRTTQRAAASTLLQPHMEIHNPDPFLFTR